MHHERETVGAAGASGLWRRLQMRGPVWLAPMAGEAACAPLVAAVCNGGGFGWLGGAYLSPVRLGEVIDGIRTLTARPFGVNLFCPQAWQRHPAREAALAAALAPFHERLGLPPPAVPAQMVCSCRPAASMRSSPRAPRPVRTAAAFWGPATKGWSARWPWCRRWSMRSRCR